MSPNRRGLGHRTLRGVIMMIAENLLNCNQFFQTLRARWEATGMDHRAMCVRAAKWRPDVQYGDRESHDSAAEVARSSVARRRIGGGDLPDRHAVTTQSCFLDTPKNELRLTPKALWTNASEIQCRKMQPESPGDRRGEETTGGEDLPPVVGVKEALRLWSEADSTQRCGGRNVEARRWESVRAPGSGTTADQHCRIRFMSWA